MQISGNVSAILNRKNPVLYTIPPDATVFDAIQMMSEKNVGSVLVVTGPTLLGVITERDYTRKIALKGKSSKTTLVSEIISQPLISVTPEHSIEECMRLMTEQRVRHLPVLEDGRLVGIVSIGDLVNWIISVQSATIDQLETYIFGQKA